MAHYTDECVKIAEAVAEGLECLSSSFRAEANDLCEVTVWIDGRVYRMTVADITDDE